MSHTHSTDDHKGRTYKSGKHARKKAQKEAMRDATERAVREGNQRQFDRRYLGHQ